MSVRDYLRKNPDAETPAYYFDLDVFAQRVELVCRELAGIPITFSMKANPFLVAELPENIVHVEVCSPGELAICKANRIPGSRIIYSGVNKGMADIAEAMAYDADIVTAESIRQAELEQAAAKQLGKVQKVILRLTGGNQFGMSESDIAQLLSNAAGYPNLHFYGIHYYAGTQKKLRHIEKDIKTLERFLLKAKEELHFIPQLVEIGPGLGVDCFDTTYDAEEELLREVSKQLLAFADQYPLGVEMGRFLAASCGSYTTRVADLKNSYDTDYVICDGGIHQLKYYGQTMAMQIPEMELISQNKTDVQKPYCICGSLCTTADILVREVELPKISIGDTLVFHRCGAYSVTEGSALFLSRELPAVYLYSQKSGLQKKRDLIEVASMNSPGKEN